MPCRCSRTLPRRVSKQVSFAFLYVRGTAGVFFVLGKGSGADDLIQAIGGKDVASEQNATNIIPATSEALVKLNPDVILTMSGGIKSTGGWMVSWLARVWVRRLPVKISALSIWVTARFCPMARILRQCFSRWLRLRTRLLREPVVAAVKSVAGARDYRASRRRRAGLTFTFWRWRCAL